MHEVFPGVFADLSTKVVEFDGTISPMLVKDDKAPSFYLEVLVCSPNTREHETFVVSSAKPSHIHAALLAVGLTPGTPGAWKLKDNKLESIPPKGDRVSMHLVYSDKDGKVIEADPLDWIVNEKDRTLFLDAEKKLSPQDAPSPPGWIFAGSRLRKREGKEVYDADGSGTIIGLTTFGSEVVGWSRVISPDAGIHAPEWIADLDKTPPASTKVRVRLKKAE